MGSAFVLFAFGGIFVYGLSWGASNSTLRLSTNSSYTPILVGYSIYTVAVSFLLNSNLNNPAILVGGLLDYTTSAWDAIEMGVFGALLIAGLPFFILSQSRPATVVGPTTVAGLVSLSAGLVFLSTDSLWLMFVSFEFLLLSALYMLLLTSKSERVRDAALEMFMWTLVGSAGLLTGLGLVGSPILNGAVPARWGFLTGLCFLIGFGVKVPLWPATSWLLKAHVEASVEFSILLSGYIVKVGVLGLYRTLLMAEAPSLNLLASALAVVGLFDAGSRLPAQRDLKRIVALTTVVEMN
jgi:formate hydrogenlyase subunit 3/multisubunit Na+/H+ antiporter MnhD subunit